MEERTEAKCFNPADCAGPCQYHLPKSGSSDSTRNEK